MAKMFDSINGVLKDLEKFLVETLKTENLSSSTKQQRSLLLEKLNTLKQEYPQFQFSDANPPIGSSPKSLPKSSSNVGISDEAARDESSFTGGSGNAEDDEGGYSDSIPFVAASDITNATKTGYLEKKRKKETVLLKSYQKRWCILKDNILYYFEKTSDKRQLGAFILKDYEVRLNPNIVKEAAKKELSFELVCPGKRSYLFVAPTKEELTEWKSSIENAALKNMMTSSMMDDPDGESIYEEFDDIIPESLVENNSDDIYDDNFNTADDLYDDAEIVPVKRVVELPPIPGSPKKLPPKGGLPPVTHTLMAKPPAPPALPERNHPLRRQSDPSGCNSSPAKLTTSVVEDTLMGDVYDDVGIDTQKFLRYNKIEILQDDFENIYYSQWDCNADNTNELAFKKGELIKILNRDFDSQSWWIGMLGDQVGLVPKTFLINAYELVA